MFLTVTAIFSLAVREAVVKRQIYSSIENYLYSDELEFNKIGTSSVTVEDYLRKLDLHKIGDQYAMGRHYARLTYRLLFEEVNKNPGTASVFTTLPNASSIATDTNGRHAEVVERFLKFT